MSDKSSGAVVVAMSGGVDSSVAAALLQRQGYQVIGITMKLWEPSAAGTHQRETTCCTIGMINDARAVCQTLGIPHYVVDLSVDFSEIVINNFVTEYLCGRTPNPCVLCNSRIKWGALLKKAEQLGADYFATGHYARIDWDESRQRFLLKTGLNPEKDQSYALWNLNQDSLRRTIFPVGALKKTEVRRIARQLDLKTADKADSQEICFVPDDYRRLLQEKAAGEYSNAFQTGEIVTTAGVVVGTHQGYPQYTIGQRRGLRIAFGKPVYVVDIRPATNQIVIGEKAELYRNGLTATQINWTGFEQLDQTQRFFVKIRYKDPGAFALVTQKQFDQVYVEFEQPQRAITPGQSVVFYKDDVVVGGGIIEQSF